MKDGKELLVGKGYEHDLELTLPGQDFIRASQLKELIAKYDKQYYEEGVSDISDAEYDRLYDEYLEFENKYPELKDMADAPTKRVGAGDVAGTTTLLPKFTHHTPLLSINKKAKELEELKAFYESIGGDGVEVIVEPKLDGITCNINFENGELVNAATRGNGYIGDLITENFKNTDTIYPESLGDFDLEIRGEAIIPYNFFKENLSKDYSNPRNAVAGIMRSINSKYVKGKGIQVMFYDIGQTSMKLENSDLSNLCRISKLSFQTVPVISASSWNELKEVVESKMNNSIQEIDGFNVLMTNGKFPQAVCDGLVIKVDDITKRYQIGMTDKGPKWAFAYKFKPLQAMTRIDHIEWQVGKSGKITPVGVFDEITLGGVKINRATLNNAIYIKYVLPLLYERRDVWINESYDNWEERIDIPFDKPIERMDYIQEGDELVDAYPQRSQSELHRIKVKEVSNDGFLINNGIYGDEWYPFEEDRYFLINPVEGLQIDDTIVVERSNDVIPRIVAIHHRNHCLYPQDMDANERYEERKNTFNTPETCPVCGHGVKQIGPQIFCQNPNCQAQLLGRLEQFVSRDGMNIVGMGSSILEVLIKKGILTNFADIYNLEKHKGEILEIEGIGIRKYNNLIKSINNSKNPELSNFIYALAIPLVGKRMSKDLAKKFGNLQKLLKATYQELLNMDDISDTTAISIYDYINNTSNLDIIDKMLNKDIVIKEAIYYEEQTFAGKTFVITGTLEHPRKYYQDIIESKGGKVSGSVSKKTYAVLIGEDAGSKEVKARELVKKGCQIHIVDNKEQIHKLLEL